MNIADAEEMAQPLKSRGMIATADIHEADVVLMNTCTVREHAEHKALSNLGRLKPWKDANPERVLIVAGCAASLWGDSLKKRFPFVDLVSPATAIETFPETVAAILKDRWNFQNEERQTFPRLTLVDGFLGGKSTFYRSEQPANEPLANAPFGSAGTAYVTIMRGCNYSCSYCIVPQVRGREKYRPMDDILTEVQKHSAAGYKEVMLLGQTVNSYYHRTEDQMKVLDFADLLRAINAIEGVESIRFMSPHPRHMRAHVIDAMADCKKVARHIHLPLQSGSDRILYAMKRLYGRAEYAAIVRNLREKLPDIRITTDIIVGYPGETEAEFSETLSLIESVRFNGLFAFKYSPRPGTVSAEAPDDVPETLKERRLQDVLALNDRLTTAL